MSCTPKIALYIFLLAWIICHSSHAQTLNMEEQKGILFLKKDGEIIDRYFDGSRDILAFRLLNDNEFLAIKNEGIFNEYYHLIKDQGVWQVKERYTMERTPNQVIQLSSTVPSNYWQIKDKVYTFRIVEIEKVEMLEDGIKIKDIKLTALPIFKE